MIVLIDNGHGINTPGKCSPDKTLYEWKYTREIAAELVSQLNELGYKAVQLVTESKDISLSQRCRRVNEYCVKYGSSNVLLISIHVNAAGSDGKWHNASGWSGWVYTKSSLKSRILAQTLYQEAKKRKLQGNRSVPKGEYWTANFQILRDTNCPAVLTENLFQDNKREVEYLLSEEGRKNIVDLHLQGIINYLNAQN